MNGAYIKVSGDRGEGVISIEFERITTSCFIFTYNDELHIPTHTLFWKLCRRNIPRQKHTSQTRLPYPTTNSTAPKICVSASTAAAPKATSQTAPTMSGCQRGRYRVLNPSTAGRRRSIYRRSRRRRSGMMMNMGILLGELFPFPFPLHPFPTSHFNLPHPHRRSRFHDSTIPHPFTRLRFPIPHSPSRHTTRHPKLTPHQPRTSRKNPPADKRTLPRWHTRG